ncbi:hypothetical protein DFH07DRAFT_1006821 [Mycena maculata]|uniref:Uncharacterized protein n=1 Tax=Mycena maculata TaxID=230809 RepID=A0AAD7JRD6_9AGAR|nr:hypothetical protein DFH07DRAFT_1006821 [Mycena maculata]
MVQFLILLIINASLFAGCNGLRNITVDDSDAAVFYSPGWSVSQGYSPGNYDGSHHFSDNESAVASFAFTGIAIYLMAPLWAYPVADFASVDSLPPVFVDLEDYTLSDEPNGPEVAPTQIVWSLANLPDAQHTIEISFVPGKQSVVIDAFIYTVYDNPAPSILSTATPRDRTPAQTRIIVGASVAGGVVIFAVLGGVFYCCWRSKRRGGNRKDGAPRFRLNASAYYSNTRTRNTGIGSRSSNRIPSAVQQPMTVTDTVPSAPLDQPEYLPSMGSTGWRR